MLWPFIGPKQIWAGPKKFGLGQKNFDMGQKKFDMCQKSVGIFFVWRPNHFSLGPNNF